MKYFVSDTKKLPNKYGKWYWYTDDACKTFQNDKHLVIYAGYLIGKETVDEVEDSIKSLKRNFKAGNYLAIATLFIIIGIASILSQFFVGNFFLQAMTYFSMALLCLLSFGLIIWRIMK